MPAEADSLPCIGRRPHPALACAASYLYGSLPLVYLLGRAGRVDLRRTGSGNVGGANLWAASGALAGALGWLFDASKGALPVLLCRRSGYAEETAGLAGVCGVAGQCWPLLLRFRGGRGVSAWVGASAAIDRRRWLASLLPLMGGSLWRVAPLLRAAPRHTGTALRRSRSKSVPLGCFAGIVIFPSLAALETRAPMPARRAPLLLTVVLLLRRLTAPLPDDAQHGPRVQRRALLYRLLFDRNTSD